MISKEKLIETIQNMPAEKFTSMDSVLEEIILMEKIENSLAASKNGEIISEQSVDEQIAQW